MMVERKEKWMRTCPNCDTAFGSVQPWGVCPNCELRFLVDYDGKVLNSGDRPQDRLSGIPLSQRTQELIARLFSKSDGQIVSDLLYRAVSGNITDCDGSTPEEMERIRFAILKLAKNSPLNFAVGIHMAQTDWRDLLMAANFGYDARQHLAWYTDQMNG